MAGAGERGTSAISLARAKPHVKGEEVNGKGCRRHELSSDSCRLLSVQGYPRGKSLSYRLHQASEPPPPIKYPELREVLSPMRETLPTVLRLIVLLAYHPISKFEVPSPFATLTHIASNSVSRLWQHIVR
jgi:hypothetical protein